MKPKFNHQFDLGYVPQAEKKTTKPSKTIPDQTLSIKELLDRYARGLPLEGNARVPVYEGEETFTPDLDHMELTDRMELLQANRDHISSLQGKLQTKQKEALKSPPITSQGDSLPLAEETRPK